MPSINHIFHIEASQEHVFDQLTSLKGLSNWWTADTRGNAAHGGEIEFFFNGNPMCTMQVVSQESAEKLTWKCTAGHEVWVGTEVTFNLSRNEGKTRIAFAHTGWAKQDDFYAICNFSWGRYLLSLRSLCETGKGEPWPMPQ